MFFFLLETFFKLVLNIFNGGSTCTYQIVQFCFDTRKPTNFINFKKINSLKTNKADVLQCKVEVNNFVCMNCVKHSLPQN